VPEHDQDSLGAGVTPAARFLGQPLSSCYAIIPAMNSATAPVGALTSIPTNPANPKSSFARNSTLRDCDSSITGTHPAEETEEKLKCESFAANLNPSSTRSAITTHSQRMQVQEMPLCQLNCPIDEFFVLEQRFLTDASPILPPQIDLALLLALRAISRTYPAGLTKLTPPNGVGTSVVDNVERRGFNRAN